MPSSAINSPIRVLVLGATGVFGSRLVERLAGEAGFKLILSARDAAKLRALAARTCRDAEIRPLDRDRIEPGDLAGAHVVVDAAGPFQGSDCKVIEAALVAQVHYIDLADGREFVGAIGRFDERAKDAGLCIVAGASSVPALSHAVIDELVRGWQRVETIQVGIFPGNRAPRGRSVVEAILTYAGKPVRVFRAGQWREVPGWGLTHRWEIKGAGKRWASVCDTPDQDLLVERYRPSRSAEFYAGAELSLMHLGLLLLSLPVRWGLMASLRPLSGVLHRMSEGLRPFGSDLGVMEVHAAGLNSRGEPEQSGWTLLAQGNRGPYVPVLPCLALLRRMRDGASLDTGAHACAGILDLEEFSADFDALQIERRINPTSSSSRRWP